MKITKFILCILFSLIVCPAKSQLSFGESVKINNNWKFTQDDVIEATSDKVSDSGWHNVDIPHDWSVKGQLSSTLASCTGYLPAGIGWYRKSIEISETRKGERVFLYFEGVYNRSDVYINGKHLGNRPNGYVSFYYDITEDVKYGQNNTIAVRVDHSQSSDSRWYTGSGIYRDVWLVYSNPNHIAPWGVFAYPEIKGEKGVLKIEVELENETSKQSQLTVINELKDPNGNIVAKSVKQQSVANNAKAKLRTEFNLNRPSMWSLESPNLYILETRVLQDGKEIDKTSTRTGFRDFKFNPNKGFSLNGVSMKMKGVCLHHDSGVLGAAVYKDVWRTRLINLKKIGVNAIRTTHNPQATALYELCDELGILVLNEAFDEWRFAKRKWVDGWNVGKPVFQGSFDFFDQWGEEDLKQMVLRDRNHISIFAWSIGNEVDYPNDPYSHPILDGNKGNGFTQPIFGGYNKNAPDAMELGVIAEKLAKVIRLYDPSRYVTAGLAGVAMSNETTYPSTLDLAGYNYTENMYDSDHEKYPNRVIYGSENRHERNVWQDVLDRDFVFGQFLWTGIDYLGESGKWPSRGFYSGLLDFAGNIKPRGYFRQSLWSDRPMAYIGTYPTPGKSSNSQTRDVWSQLTASNESGDYQEKTPSMDAWPIWNYQEGQLIRVVVYTNASKARLELNEKVIGDSKIYDANSGILHWDIPFQRGKLELIAENNEGKEIYRTSLSSSSKPYKITIAESSRPIDKGGVVQIRLQIVDEKGIPVMLSDNEITCQVVGPAKLLGLEAGNNEDMSDYTDNKHRAYHGQLTAYIQTLDEAGEIKVHFTSPWLQSAEENIKLNK